MSKAKKSHHKKRPPIKIRWNDHCTDPDGVPYVFGDTPNGAAIVSVGFHEDGARAVVSSLDEDIHVDIETVAYKSRTVAQWTRTLQLRLARALVTLHRKLERGGTVL